MKAYCLNKISEVALKTLNEKENRTIIMVLHDLNHAARFSHQLIAMREGTLVRQGSVDEIMRNDVLKEIFGIDARIVTDPRTNKPVCLSYDLL